MRCARKYYSGPRHHNWKGGRYYNGNGYVLIYAPAHPRSRRNNYVLEHVLVAEQKLGRRLQPEEIVHHLNGIRDDNRPENISVLLRSEHKSWTVTRLLQARIRELEGGAEQPPSLSP